jgi:hypothetical protein
MKVKNLIDRLNGLNSRDREVRIAYDGGNVDCGIEDVFIYDGTENISAFNERDLGIVVIRTDQ